MSEAFVLAIVGVGGTIFGAAVAPALGLARDVVTGKATAKTSRLRAAASFGELLLKSASIVERDYGKSAAVKARTLAIEKRFDLAQHLPRRSGQVDRFAECAIAELDNTDEIDRRRVAAEYAASQLLSWARGDLRAKKLALFKVIAHDGEWVVMDKDGSGKELAPRVKFRKGA